jgi:DNA polymerase III epsilon subunit-like protein
VKKIINGRKVIGHNLQEDFNILNLRDHDLDYKIVDIAHFSKFNRAEITSRKSTLSELAVEFLNSNVNNRHHSSIIDARASLALYRAFQSEIEYEEHIHSNIEHELSSLLNKETLKETVKQQLELVMNVEDEHQNPEVRAKQ